MSIEKAFAINAEPAVIYTAIEHELAEAAVAESGAFEVLRRDPPHTIDLRVTMGGVPCYLTYRLDPKEGHTEVTAILQPVGMKYAMFRIMTLGMRDQGFEIALVQGLANLKYSVEQGDDAGDEEEAPWPPE